MARLAMDQRYSLSQVTAHSYNGEGQARGKAVICIESERLQEVDGCQR